MFYFPQTTEINKSLDLDLIFKVVNNNLKTNDSNLIEDVTITNIIDNETTSLKTSAEYNMIYIIKVDVYENKIPFEFLEVLDKFIELPVLYEIHCVESGDSNYILPIKINTSQGFKLKRIFVSGWCINFYAIDVLKNKTSIESAYKTLIETLTFNLFKTNESITQFVDRLISEFNSFEIGENKKHIYFYDKGFNSYKSIRNSYMLITTFKPQKLIIRSDAFEENERVEFGEGVIHAFIMEANKGKILLSEKFPSYYKTDEYIDESLDVLSDKLKTLYKEIDTLHYKSMYGGYYEKRYNELKKLIKKYELSIAKRWCFFSFKFTLLDGLNEVNFNNSDFALFIFSGCSVKHYQVEDFNIYKFYEIK